MSITIWFYLMDETRFTYCVYDDELNNSSSIVASAAALYGILSQ